MKHEWWHDAMMSLSGVGNLVGAMGMAARTLANDQRPASRVGDVIDDPGDATTPPSTLLIVARVDAILGGYLAVVTRDDPMQDMAALQDVIAPLRFFLSANEARQSIRNRALAQLRRDLQDAQSKEWRAVECGCLGAKIAQLAMFSVPEAWPDVYLDVTQPEPTAFDVLCAAHFALWTAAKTAEVAAVPASEPAP